MIMRMQGRREKRDRYHVAEESDLYGVRAYGSSRYHEQPSISGHEVAQAASSAPTEPTCYPTNSNRTPAADNEEPTLMKPKRFCRAPGCIRVIKSQGHCQRHGAKVKRCRVEGELSRGYTVLGDATWPTMCIYMPLSRDTTLCCLLFT